MADRYIVTFKRKDARQDARLDKQELLATAIGREPAFASAGELEAGVPGSGYDVDRYEAPILIAELSPEEAAALADAPDVVSVEPDGEISAPPEEEVDIEPMAAVEDPIPKGVAAIAAPQAWGASRGAGVKVAVVDSGIDYDHLDLADNYRGGVSLVENEPDPMDLTGHGTHCAGIIAASGGQGGISGVAPAVDLYGVRVLGVGLGAWSWLIEGIDWCIANNMDVVSMSLSAESVPTAMRELCDLAWARGIIMVAAAGNGLGAPVNFPARLAPVVAVSALNDEGKVSMLSNVGDEIELCAPGVQILSTDLGGGYKVRTGTSQATPHVAGAAALAIGSHRFTNRATVRRTLAATADKLAEPPRTPQFGYGRVHAARAALLMDPPEGGEGAS